MVGPIGGLAAGTFLVGLKSTGHFFLADCHTGMKIIQIVVSRCVCLFAQNAFAPDTAQKLTVSKYRPK